MTDVSILQYNHSDVSAITFNGISLESLAYNDFIWPPSHSAALELSPILIDSDSGVKTNFNNPIYLNGGSKFLVETPSARPKDISVPAFVGGYFIMPIDQFGYMVSYRIDGGWDGGNSAAAYTRTIPFSYGETTVNAIFKGRVDEDNTVFHEGEYLNKVIKIPSGGSSGQVWFTLYPYTFDSKYYSDRFYPYVCLLDKFNLQDVGQYDNNTKKFQYYKYGSVVSEKPLSDTLFSDLSVSAPSSLSFHLGYAVGANPTNGFREAILTVEGSVLVHFLQEPSSKYRIYHGYTSDYQYLHTFDYSTYFHTLGSTVLSGDFELYNTNTSTGMSVLYPSALSESYSITTEGSVSDASTSVYTWDGIPHVYRRISSGGKLIFTKL